VHDVERDDESVTVGTVPDRAGPPGSAGQEAPDGRLRGGGIHQHLLPALAGGLLDGDHRRAGLGREPAVADLDDGTGARHVEDEPARHGDGLAVVAGALAAGGDRHVVTHGGRDDRRDLLGVTGEDHEVGEAQRQLFTDHRRESRAVERGPLTRREVHAHPPVAEEVTQLGLEAGEVGHGWRQGRGAAGDNGGHGMLLQDEKTARTVGLTTTRRMPVVSA